MANHHFVPKFYLKKFCDPNVPPNPEPYLWVSPRNGGDWKKRAPKNVGAIPSLYSIPTNGGDDEIVEKFFSTIEGPVADLYKHRFNVYEGPVGKEERKLFALFVALFAIRSPFYRQNIKRFSEEVGEKILRMTARRSEIVARDMKQYEQQTGKSPGLSVQEYQDAVLGGKVRLEVLPHYLTTMALQQLETIARIVFIMRWRFLIAPQGEYFSTADSPANWQDLTPRPPAYRGHGLAMRNVELTLPLSSRFCFLGRWGRPTGVVIATPFQVREITNRTISWSTSEVYSPVPFKRSLLAPNSSRPLYPQLK